MNEAFAKDEIGVGHALLLAKLQPEQQEEALAACYQATYTNGNKPKRIPFPVRHLQRWIEHNILLELAAARFSVAVFIMSLLAYKDRLVYIREMAQPTDFQSQRGRPRSFDTEVAVERAMQVFWSRGYHGTSLPDLLGATRLSRGSLYAAFGDKHGLFLRALDRYIDESLARLDVELNSQKSALGGLRACLAGYVERTSGLNGKRGCLVVATAMELAAHDADVQKRIRWFFKAMEMRLTIAVTRAQGAGELIEHVEAANIARLLVCAVEGLRVLGKMDLDQATWQSSADLLLDRFIK